MRLVALTIVFLAIVSVHAGVLLIEADAPRLTVTWLQGVERSTVHYANMEVYRRNMTLMAGPNQCFVIGADGNDRAIYITPESDDIGPRSPDAIVDCRICGCEDQPDTRFTCRSDGRCQPCDPCGAAACSDGEVCIRENCDTATCTCDPVLCSGSTCDERVSITNRCQNERCIVERTCIRGMCGAECTSGLGSERSYCQDDVLMRERTTCTPSCTQRTQTSIIADCSERECPIGTLPRCTSEGCACI